MITNKEFFKYSRIQPAYSGHFMVYLKAIERGEGILLFGVIKFLEHRKGHFCYENYKTL